MGEESGEAQRAAARFVNAGHCVACEEAAEQLTCPVLVLFCSLIAGSVVY